MLSDAPFVERDISRNVLIGLLWAAAIVSLIYLITLVYQFGHIKGEQNAAKKRPFQVYDFEKHRNGAARGQTSKSGRSYSSKLRPASEDESKQPA